MIVLGGKRRVLLVEFSIYNQYPLVSGYLHALARADRDLDAAFEFRYYQEEVGKVAYAETLARILAAEPSIVCISCYVWNMGLVRRLLADLRQVPSIERIVLGGHQVSNQIARYVDRTDGKTLVVNGEGEAAFCAALKRVAAGEAPTGIAGISLYVDGELADGGAAPMVDDLESFPSPFLTGCFDDMSYPMSIFETNRGCPYRCSFCTWGGDTLKVRKFSTERVRDELRWLAKKRVLFIYLADANWGMLPRDIELSEYIGQLKRTLGSPWMVYYAAAKNKPKGSIACIEKFHAAGVITSQALGMQSLSKRTLELIDRQNIKNEAFTDMFAALDARGISSYCELIWPLPGETLASVTHSFAELVELGARTVILYPAILINNARMTNQRDEFAMESEASDDWKSEVEVVESTRHASRADVADGLWRYYGFFLLGNCDPKKALLRYLGDLAAPATPAERQQRTVEILTAFAAFLREGDAPGPYATLLTTLFAQRAHGDLLTIGRLAAHLTHEQRSATQRLLCEFFLAQAGEGDVRRTLAMAVLLAFSLPRIFLDSREDVARVVEVIDAWGRARGVALAELASVRSERQVTTIDVTGGAEAWNAALAYFVPAGQAAVGASGRIEIRHASAGRLAYTSNGERDFVYAHGMIQRSRDIEAEVRLEPVAHVLPAEPQERRLAQ